MHDAPPEPGAPLGPGTLVLGCHRGGTSAAALALQVLGNELGEPLGEPSPHNPRGYGELWPAIQLDERLLATRGCTWDDIREVPAAPLPPPPGDPGLAEPGDPIRCRALLQAHFTPRAWALKDPRLSRLLGPWLEGCEGIDLALVLVVRPLEEVVASLRARDGFSEAKAVRLWFLQLAPPLELPGSPALALLGYPALLEDPVGSLRRVAEALGRSWPEDPTTREGELRELLDPTLRRQRPAAEQAEALRARWPACVALAEHLLAATHTSAPPERVPAPLRAARAETEPGPELLAEHLGQLGRRYALESRRHDRAHAHLERAQASLESRREHVQSLQQALQRRTEALEFYRAAAQQAPGQGNPEGPQDL